MPRLGLGLGLNLPRPIFLGGGSPSVPVGALATYTAYSPSNFTLVTGNNVNEWNDETTNANNLTQGTSANQPKLVEDNTLTQFTANNQPTFAKDKQVTQSTLSNMPTYDAVEGALTFEPLQGLGGLPPHTQSFTFKFDIKSTDIVTTNKIIDGNGSSEFYYAGGGTVIILRADDNTFVSFAAVDSIDVRSELELRVDNGLASIYIDDVLQSSQDVTGKTYTFNNISDSGSTSGFKGYLYSLKQWNSAVSTGTPDFELDGSNPTTMLNDSDAQPSDGDEVRLWHDPSAVDVVAFDDGEDNSLSGLQVNSSAFAVEFKFNQTNDIASGGIFSESGSLINIMYQRNGFGDFRFWDSLGIARTIGIGLDFTTPKTYKFINDGSTLSLLVDDVLNDSIAFTGVIFTFSKLGRDGSDSIVGNLYSFKAWNSADSSGAPDFTLTPDPTKMRTSANANPVLGQGVAKWYADEWSGYRDNHVLFDPVKYMEGLPTQAGDFTYVFKYKDNDQATAGAIVSSNIDASGIFNVDGDTTDLRAGDATNYLFDNTGATTYRIVAYLKSGNDVYNVTDYVTTPTQDATGKAFNLTSLGKATSGKDMEIKEFYVYDRELTGSDLDYFYYLRNTDTGEILLPPLLPS